MNRLDLIDELLIMVRTGEMKLSEGAAEAENTLLDIRRIVCKALTDEIFEDITDRDMGFYAPEFQDWKEYLNFLNGCSDYAVALDGYTEEELESFWNKSHIAEHISAGELEKELKAALDSLKMLQFINKVGNPAEPAVQRRQEMEILSKIRGLYNLLYEE